MRGSRRIRAIGVVGLFGAVGLTAALTALVNELLSPWWAVLTALALAAIVVAGCAAIISARGVLRRTLHDVVVKRAEDGIRGQTSAIERALASQRQAVQQHVERQTRQTRREINDLYSQFEALDALYRRLEPARPFPPLRRWAISPDLALHLVGLVLDGGVRTVIETGSGSSTVLLGLALEKVGGGRVVALEHDPTYAAETRRLLEEFGLADRAQVVDAPLESTDVGQESFLWYDLSGTDLPASVDLLVVDGPPEAIGHQARFPALPLLQGVLSDSALVVLDDGDRTDEAAIAERWSALDGVGQVRTLAVERRAFQLTVERPRRWDGDSVATVGTP